VGTQTITFPQPPNSALGSGPVTLNATASSGLPVTYSSSSSTICTVSGSSVTLVSAGTCSLAANQAGNANYAAAKTVTQTFTVLKSQTITFPQPANSVLGSAAVTLKATVTSGLALSYTSNTPLVCTVSASSATLVSAGTCSITASQAGNATYAPATPVTQTFTVLSTQTITFPKPPSSALSGGPVLLNASASSGLPVSYSSSTAAVCTVSGSSVTLVSLGTCSITASQPGNAAYAAAASVTQTFTVSVATQTITFPQPPTSTLGSGLVPLNATTSSGLAVSYSSNSPTVCTVSGSSVTLVAAGTCSITANQAGNSKYAPATPVTQTFAVFKTQTITFPQPANSILGSGPVALNATATSGLLISYSTNSPLVCTVSGSSVTLVSLGTCSITANQAGNSTYVPATPVSNTFAVLNGQTITFPQPANSVLGSGPVTLNAAASSGLPVTYSSNAVTICTVSGSSVTLVSGGTCSITANQAGSATYAPATPVTQSFTILKTQTIAFPQPANSTLAGSPVPVNATSSSGSPVFSSSNTPTVCTVSGFAFAAYVTLVSIGTCSITANQPGDSVYAPAPPVTRSFSVWVGATQTITFQALPPSIPFGSTLSLKATASSGLPVSFSGNSPAVCNVAGYVTVIGLGTCSITASQPGNANYAPASVTQSFTVAVATQTISFLRPSNAPIGTTLPLGAMASSGLPVAYTSNTPAVCTVSRSFVTYLNWGTCSITASQAGNADYAPAPPVTQNSLVTPGIGVFGQTITFPALPPSAPFGGVVFLNATASSGLPVSFTSNSPGVCTVAVNLEPVNAAYFLELIAVGTCSVTASQAGNANNPPAVPVTQSFIVQLGLCSICIATIEKPPSLNDAAGGIAGNGSARSPRDEMGGHTPPGAWAESLSTSAHDPDNVLKLKYWRRTGRIGFVTSGTLETTTNVETEPEALAKA
jgi:hypothetical protein